MLDKIKNALVSPDKLSRNARSVPLSADELTVIELLLNGAAVGVRTLAPAAGLKLFKLFVLTLAAGIGAPVTNGCVPASIAPRSGAAPVYPFV